MRGWLLRLLARQDEGEADYQKAFDLDQRDFQTTLGLAHYCRKSGAWEQFDSHTRTLTELLASEDYYSRSCYAALHGNVSQALEHLRVAVEKGEIGPKLARIDPDLQILRANAASLVQLEDVLTGLVPSPMSAE